MWGEASLIISPTRAMVNVMGGGVFGGVTEGLGGAGGSEEDWGDPGRALQLLGGVHKGVWGV